MKKRLAKCYLLYKIITHTKHVAYCLWIQTNCRMVFRERRVQVGTLAVSIEQADTAEFIHYVNICEIWQSDT